mmetsp:Transcript_87016/g.274785  ORF Transcript_87016/g.274785 Transcript_87016/m.274785 type:complete len:265 (+) Transcript_87016:236-1030(+)
MSMRMLEKRQGAEPLASPSASSGRRSRNGPMDEPSNTSLLSSDAGHSRAPLTGCASSATCSGSQAIQRVPSGGGSASPGSAAGSSSPSSSSGYSQGSSMTTSAPPKSRRTAQTPPLTWRLAVPTQTACGDREATRSRSWAKVALSLPKRVAVCRPLWRRRSHLSALESTASAPPAPHPSAKRARSSDASLWESPASDTRPATESTASGASCALLALRSCSARSTVLWTLSRSEGFCSRASLPCNLAICSMSSAICRASRQLVFL